MPELSVIVPVYKVEKWLPRCIDSILAQTFPDFELILIDDGSPDDCGTLCDEYSAEDFRIRVIHQKNGGVSAARNAGLKIARGKYIGFVDPDDWIEPEMYNSMLKLTTSDPGVDLVGTGYDCVEGNRIVNGGRNTLYLGRMDFQQYMSAFFATPPPFSRGVCVWLFKKELLRDKFDLRLSMSEDGKFLFQYALNCRRVEFTNSVGYHVFVRTDSATRQPEAKFFGEVSFYSEILSLIHEIFREKTFSRDIYYKAMACFLDACMRDMLRSRIKDDKRMIRRKFVDYVKTHKKDFLLNSQIGLKFKIACLLAFLKWGI